jgi:transcriptional regulator with XRE-family HTH domain
MLSPSASVRLKRLRQRFGISAPKLAIRTHIAWYWRALAITALLSISFAIAAWIYDAGMRIAGYHSNESSREIQSLRNHMMELDTEVTKLRSLAGSGESKLLIEQAAQKELSQQVRFLELENAALKQDLAFFEGLLPAAESGIEPGLRIDNLRLIPAGNPGEFRYRMLVINNSVRQIREIRGVLQFHLRVLQAGKDAMITIPSGVESGSSRYQFEVKRFLRLEGSFSIPEDATLKTLEAHLIQDGVLQAKHTLTF